MKQLTNQHKIIAACVAGAGVMAALHFLLYEPKNAEIQAARGAFQNANSQLGGLQIPVPEDELRAFERQTAETRLQTLQFLRASNVALPNELRNATDPDENPQIRARMQARIREKLAEFQALRNQPGMPAMEFLDAPSLAFPRRWDVLESFTGPLANPQTLRQRVADTLYGQAATLEQLSPDDREERLPFYLQLLGQSGLLDTRALAFIEPEHGTTLGMMTRLNRIELLRAALEPEDFNARNQQEFLAALETIVRLEWNEPDWISTTLAVRQLEGARDLIDIAAESGVAAVTEIGFGRRFDITTPQILRDDVADGRDPVGFGGMGDFGFGGMGDFGFFPGAMPGDMGDFGMFPGGPLPGDLPGGAGDPDKRGEATTVTISVAGTHDQVIAFLDRLTTSPRFYKIDGLAIFNDTSAGASRVVGRATVFFPIRLTRGALDLSAEDLDRRIAEAEEALARLGGGGS